MKQIALILPLMLYCILFAASTPLRAADESEILTNASITELKSMGLSDGPIITKIKISKCNFDTSVAALKQLKDAQVSDEIIQAMMSAMAKPETPTVPSPAPAAAL